MGSQDLVLVCVSLSPTDVKHCEWTVASQDGRKHIELLVEKWAKKDAAFCHLSNYGKMENDDYQRISLTL